MPDIKSMFSVYTRKYFKLASKTLGETPNMPKAYIYPKLQRTGLANMLFIWGRALIKSRETGAMLIAPDWFQPLRKGPIVRREKYLRYYLNSFTNFGYLKGWRKYLTLFFGKQTSLQHLDVKDEVSKLRSVIYVVDESEGFSPFVSEHEFIRQQLQSIVTPKIMCRVNSACEPRIGVHIRKGDFKLIGQDIPIDWYVRVCQELRAGDFENYPICVFTDGKQHEVEQLLKLENTKLMPKADAIEDLLLLSRSDVIVGTSMSTFSLWASFLNLKPTIWSPISPGVFGYGLDTENHYRASWDGQIDYSSNPTGPLTR